MKTATGGAPESARDDGRERARRWEGRGTYVLIDGVGIGCAHGEREIWVVRPRAVKSELPRGVVKKLSQNMHSCTKVSTPTRVHMKSLHLRRIHATDATT